MPLQRQVIEQLPVPSRASSLAIINSSIQTDIPAQLSDWHSQSVLIVASASLNRNTSIITDVKRQLGSIVEAEKIGVGAHTPYADVISITSLIHSHSIDTIICIGSSSYGDGCKIARLLASSLSPNPTNKDIESIVDQEKGITPASAIKPPTTKLILVPTSLSAAEWNAVASATNKEGKKQHFGDFDGDIGASDLICLDPKVAATAPETLWLASGVRAVDHCVEVRCHMLCTPEAAEGAERGLRALLKGLTEYKQAKDVQSKGGEIEEKGAEYEKLLEGISKCQVGARDAIMGVILHRIPMGPSHAIGHQLGGVAGVMHGVTSCIMLAPVLKYTETWNPDAQKALLGLFNDGMGWEEKRLGDAMERFVRSLELPTRLSEVGVTEEKQIEMVAEHTLTDVWGRGKRQLDTKEQVMDILNMVR